MQQYPEFGEPFMLSEKAVSGLEIKTNLERLRGLIHLF
jgi:hypothetical protein